MRIKPIAFMLATLVYTPIGWANAAECPALRDAKRADGHGEGAFILEVDTLFKCHGDAESFEGALAGLTGALAGQKERAYGIIALGDNNYFASVATPYEASAPAFYEHGETYYACITLQRLTVDDAAQGVQGGGDGLSPPDESMAAAYVPASRLLQASLEPEPESEPKSEADAPTKSSQQSDAAEQAKASDPSDAPHELPGQSRNPFGLRPPQPPPLSNTPAAMPEMQGKEDKPDDLPGQARNPGGLRPPQPPPLENTPEGMREPVEPETKSPADSATEHADDDVSAPAAADDAS